MNQENIHEIKTNQTKMRQSPHFLSKKTNKKKTFDAPTTFHHVGGRSLEKGHNKNETRKVDQSAFKQTGLRGILAISILETSKQKRNQPWWLFTGNVVIKKSSPGDAPTGTWDEEVGWPSSETGDRKRSSSGVTPQEKETRRGAT